MDTCLATWNETDPARRARHIERAWTGDGVAGVDVGFFGERPTAE